MEDPSTAAAEARIAKIREDVWARHPEWGELKVTDDLDALVKDAATLPERAAWERAQHWIELVKDYQARMQGRD